MRLAVISLCLLTSVFAASCADRSVAKKNTPSVSFKGASPRRKAPLLRSRRASTRKRAILSLADDARKGSDNLRAGITLIFMRRLRSEPSPLLRQLLIAELADFACAAAIQAYLEALSDPSAEVRVAAVRALRGATLPSSLSALRDLALAANDPHPAVRREALYAFTSQAPAEESLPILRRLVNDSSDQVALAAREELARFTAAGRP